MAVFHRRPVPFAAVLTVAAAMTAAPAAGAAPSSFRTSFETTDPAPTWENTPETPAKGVVPGAGEITPTAATDHDLATTWQVPSAHGTLTADLSGTYKYFKLDLAAAPGAAKTSVAEVELLGHR
ncbi:hypothetical protein OG439_05840 [Amycolatopsis sp. NBC_01307]|uniref:hypothetical protein n=1 Tax=Amycolatopsis sp. NBC_01307 TaxID=2903561 RepID=UPI002E12B4AA|nr:hypothetical protein OG439_05840 [Amycolatopsis sp. NBC_01307]